LCSHYYFVASINSETVVYLFWLLLKRFFSDFMLSVDTYMKSDIRFRCDLKSRTVCFSGVELSVEVFSGGTDSRMLRTVSLQLTIIS